jgi:hypothetical protein
MHFVRDATTNEVRVMFVNDSTQQTSWVLAYLDAAPKYQIEIRRQGILKIVCF